MAYNPYRRYSSYWWKYWKHLPYDVLYFLRRLWEYAPLLWDDEDWDYSSLLKLMRYKLHRMRPVIEGGIGIHSHHRALEVHQAEVMIDNVFEDPDDEWSMHYDAYHFNKEIGCQCPKPEECRKALDDSYARSERNWHALWAHLDEKMRGWWDVVLIMIGVWSCIKISLV